MKNKIIVSAAKFLAFCMASCTCVLFVVLRIGFWNAPFFLFAFPESYSGPQWFAVCTSVPSIPLVILLFLVCLFGMWREAKHMKDLTTTEE